jgi:hypothetical protein
MDDHSVGVAPNAPLIIGFFSGGQAVPLPALLPVIASSNGDSGQNQAGQTAELSAHVLSRVGS